MTGEHTIQIVVDRDNRTLTVDKDPLYIRPGDFVSWEFDGEHPWTVHFAPISPLTHRRIVSEGTPMGYPVRDPLAPGKYSYFVAAMVNGQIYTADPELIDENEG